MAIFNHSYNILNEYNDISRIFTKFSTSLKTVQKFLGSSTFFETIEKKLTNFQPFLTILTPFDCILKYFDFILDKFREHFYNFQAFKHF